MRSQGSVNYISLLDSTHSVLVLPNVSASPQSCVNESDALISAFRVQLHAKERELESRDKRLLNLNITSKS